MHIQIHKGGDANYFHWQKRRTHIADEIEGVTIAKTFADHALMIVADKTFLSRLMRIEESIWRREGDTSKKPQCVTSGRCRLRTIVLSQAA